jgi:hypothetical protein
MKVILNCTNLLGDSLYLLKPVQVFLQQVNKEEMCCIVTDKGLAWEMFAGVFSKDFIVIDDVNLAKAQFPDAVVLDLNAGRSGEYTFGEASKGRPQLHISEGYAHFLGVDLHHELKPPTDWAVIKETLPRTFCAISPFSRSCSRHSGEVPNKTLDDHKWEYLIRYLRRQGMPVKVIAGPNDKLTNNSVPVNDYFTAKNLYDLEYFLKSCALLISVDNGLGHIASLLDTPMISLWPKVSCIDFIYPRFSEKTACVLMEPNTATPSQLLAGIRHFAKNLLGDLHVEESETIQLEG